MQINVKTISRYFHSPMYQIGKWLFNRVPDLLPDYVYIHILWRKSMGYKLNLKNPKTYNEKLQWLKLYYRDPVYPVLVDKFAVKQWVAQKVGEQYIIPTLGVYDDVDSIDFDRLPDRFVLKCTHDSGSTVICRDKEHFDIRSSKEKLNRCLHTDYYLSAREWPYKTVPRRIIAEEYIGGEDADLLDYKFFVFDGKVKFFKIDFNRWDRHGARYFNRDAEVIECVRIALPDYPYPLTLPDEIPQMIDLAEQIGAGMPHVRVDFYDVDGDIRFGECTFFTAAGFGPFTDKKWDYIFGNEIVLTPQMKNRR